MLRDRLCSALGQPTATKPVKILDILPEGVSAQPQQPQQPQQNPTQRQRTNSGFHQVGIV